MTSVRRLSRIRENRHVIERMLPLNSLCGLLRVWFQLQIVLAVCYGQWQQSVAQIQNNGLHSFINQPYRGSANPIFEANQPQRTFGLLNTIYGSGGPQSSITRQYGTSPNRYGRRSKRSYYVPKQEQVVWANTTEDKQLKRTKRQAMMPNDPTPRWDFHPSSFARNMIETMTNMMTGTNLNRPVPAAVQKSSTENRNTSSVRNTQLPGSTVAKAPTSQTSRGGARNKGPLPQPRGRLSDRLINVRPFPKQATKMRPRRPAAGPPVTQAPRRRPIPTAGNPRMPTFLTSKPFRGRAGQRQPMNQGRQQPMTGPPGQPTLVDLHQQQLLPIPQPKPKYKTKPMGGNAKQKVTVKQLTPIASPAEQPLPPMPLTQTNPNQGPPIGVPPLPPMALTQQAPTQQNQMAALPPLQPMRLTQGPPGAGQLPPQPQQRPPQPNQPQQQPQYQVQAKVIQPQPDPNLQLLNAPVGPPKTPALPRRQNMAQANQPPQNQQVFNQQPMMQQPMVKQPSNPVLPNQQENQMFNPTGPPPQQLPNTVLNQQSYNYQQQGQQMMTAPPPNQFNPPPLPNQQVMNQIQPGNQMFQQPPSPGQFINQFNNQQQPNIQVTKLQQPFNQNPPLRQTTNPQTSNGVFRRTNQVPANNMQPVSNQLANQNQMNTQSTLLNQNQFIPPTNVNQVHQQPAGNQFMTPPPNVNQMNQQPNGNQFMTPPPANLLNQQPNSNQFMTPSQNVNQMNRQQTGNQFMTPPSNVNQMNQMNRQPTGNQFMTPPPANLLNQQPNSNPFMTPPPNANQMNQQSNGNQFMTPPPNVNQMNRQPQNNQFIQPPNGNQRKPLRKRQRKRKNGKLVPNTTINRALIKPLSSKKLWTPIQNTGTGQPVVTNNTATKKKKKGIPLKTWFNPAVFDISVTVPTAPAPTQKSPPLLLNQVRVSGRRQSSLPMVTPRATTLRPQTTQRWRQTVMATQKPTPASPPPRRNGRRMNRPLGQRKKPVQHPPVLQRDAWSQTKTLVQAPKLNPINRPNDIVPTVIPNIFVNEITTTTVSPVPTYIPRQPMTMPPPTRSAQRRPPPLRTPPVRNNPVMQRPQNVQYAASNFVNTPTTLPPLINPLMTNPPPTNPHPTYPPMRRAQRQNPRPTAPPTYPPQTNPPVVRRPQRQNPRANPLPTYPPPTNPPPTNPPPMVVRRQQPRANPQPTLPLPTHPPPTNPPPMLRRRQLPRANPQPTFPLPTNPPPTNPPPSNPSPTNPPPMVRRRQQPRAKPQPTFPPPTHPPPTNPPPTIPPARVQRQMARSFVNKQKQMTNMINQPLNALFNFVPNVTPPTSPQPQQRNMQVQRRPNNAGTWGQVTTMPSNYPKTTGASFKPATPQRRRQQQPRRKQPVGKRARQPRRKKQRRPAPARRQPQGTTTTAPWTPTTTVGWQGVRKQRPVGKQAPRRNKQPRPTNPPPAPTRPVYVGQQTHTTMKPKANNNELLNILRKIANSGILKKDQVSTTLKPYVTTQAPANQSNNELLTILRKIANSASNRSISTNTNVVPISNITNVVPPAIPLDPTLMAPLVPAIGHQNMQLLLDAMAHNHHKTESLNTIVMNMLQNQNHKQPQGTMFGFDPNILPIIDLTGGQGGLQNSANTNAVMSVLMKPQQLPEPRSCKCYPKIIGCPMDKKMFVDLIDCNGDSEVTCCDDN